MKAPNLEAGFEHAAAVAGTPRHASRTFSRRVSISRWLSRRPSWSVERVRNLIERHSAVDFSGFLSIVERRVVIYHSFLTPCCHSGPSKWVVNMRQAISNDG